MNSTSGPSTLPVSTWAALPAASTVPSGTVYRVSDVGIAPGARFVSDGTRWRADGVIVLSDSAVAVSCGADTTEDTLATITVPANALGPNGVVRITTIWSATNNANSKTARVRFSGAAGTAYLSQVIATQQNLISCALIANRNATNSQVGQNLNGVASTLSATSAVDTTAATTVVITGQKASAGDALTLESYLVELIPGG